ncbi:hypothetical protein [Streptomyces sp. NPDC050121]|uniref:hypothetical protein n=1 Tax=Streptomyces sp. NPDC050121 TaxID=3365601 RepID=UPI003799FD46
MSGESYAVGDAWALADRAIAFAQRACTHMNTHVHDAAARTTAHRAVALAAALYYRAEAIEKAANHREAAR